MFGAMPTGDYGDSLELPVSLRASSEFNKVLQAFLRSLAEVFLRALSLVPRVAHSPDNMHVV